MDPEFWQTRWRENRIGFHEGRPNPLLVAHLPALGERRSVLVPLAGKAFDVLYLGALGHRVVAVELVEAAVQAFFAEHGIEPVLDQHGPFVRYRAGSLVFLAGDYFAATSELLGPIDTVYDRAALIALPPASRPRYLDHTRGLLLAGARETSRAPAALVITFEYDERERTSPPPPHAVFEDEVRAGYARDGLEVCLLADVDALDDRQRAAGVTACREKAWLVGPVRCAPQAFDSSRQEA